MAGEGVVSHPVLNEFCSVLLHKLKPATPALQVLAALDSLAPIRLAPTGGAIVRRAVEASRTYGVHFFDGFVIASAEREGCSRIYSEDLNHSQLYFGDSEAMHIQEPFHRRIEPRPGSGRAYIAM